MLKAVEKIVALAEEKNITFPEAVLLLDSKESGISVEEIRARMSERLADMRRSVREACANTIPCRIEEPMGAKLRAHGGGMAGEFIAVAEAAAMGSAALVYLEGGSPAASAHAAAMTFKSVLGLACDPVGGLVECPCIKRNGILVANGILCADMALAGIESAIPLDEVIDSMGQIGRMMAPALRETSQGGLAVTPTAAEIVKRIDETGKLGG